MQFEPMLKDPDGKTLLPKYVDPALDDDYPLDAVWKVRNHVFLKIKCWGKNKRFKDQKLVINSLSF